MTTVQMRTIRTNDGSLIKVEADTDDATIAILKAAPVTAFSEFVYTGNSSRGENNGNYDDLEAFFLNSGLKIEDDDLNILIWNMERVTGCTALQHRGKTIRYHVQARQGEGHREFGYTWRAEYRLIEVS